MVIFLIWLIGFAISYIILRKSDRSFPDYGWDDIFINLIVSLFSWAFVLPIFIIGLFSLILDEIKKTKPPRWL